MSAQTLQLSQEQRLQMVLAPQLRQSLEMLQAPVQELRALIREELDRNPTLEEAPTDMPHIEIESTAPTSNEDAKSLDFRKEFEILSRLDDEWRDYFFQEKEGRPYNADDVQKRDYMLDSITQGESLQEHLIHQLGLAELSDGDKSLGEMIIGNINDDGYLTSSMEELSATSGADIHHLQDLLHVIHEFDPPGVGARDIKECLLIQLERLGKTGSLAHRLVESHLDRLAQRKMQEIAKFLKVPVEEVEATATFIATLEPKPGRAYTNDLSTYITPEVIVKRVDGQYVVFMNDDDLPRLRISKQYRTLMHDDSTGKDVRSYIEERIRSSAFLIKSIYQRQQTIYKIAAEIVRVQTDFLDQGIKHLKPLTMAEVASVVGLHETTVSRAVAGKHMQTPQGVFDMKYFFTPGLRKHDGSVVSNKTVKDAIETLVAEENTASPLSDQEILDILTERGIHIARRTVAKYRIALKIAPSHMRRKYG